MVILLFAAGIILLMLGADFLVKGASRMAAALRISPLVIGLTVVAYGTGAPEAAVSIQAAISGQGDITVGNIIGSNIVNILLILGSAAVIMPLSASHKLVRLDVPLLIVVSILVLILALDGSFTRYNGLFLVFILIIYTVYLIYNGREEVKAYDKQAISTKSRPVRSHARFDARQLLLVFTGIILLVIGAAWMVNGAVYFAQYLGMSELVIGLTIVSIGTSLPELTTTIVASLRNERNIAVGNIIGSCLFNLLGVLGLSSLFTAADLPVAASVIRFDLPVMIAVSFACLPIFFTGGIISRWEAILFLGFYAAYIAYLIMAEAHHEAIPVFSAAMLYFVIPLTAITLFILSMLEFRKRHQRK